MWKVIQTERQDEGTHKTHYLNQRGDSIKVEDEVLVDDPIAPEESILEYTGEEEKK